MKQFAIRLAVLTTVVSGGAMAIAQAQWLLNKPEQRQRQPADAVPIDLDDASPRVAVPPRVDRAAASDDSRRQASPEGWPVETSLDQGPVEEIALREPGRLRQPGNAAPLQPLQTAADDPFFNASNPSPGQADGSGADRPRGAARRPHDGKVVGRAAYAAEPDEGIGAYEGPDGAEHGSRLADGAGIETDTPGGFAADQSDDQQGWPADEPQARAAAAPRRAGQQSTGNGGARRDDPPADERVLADELSEHSEANHLRHEDGASLDPPDEGPALAEPAMLPRESDAPRRLSPAPAPRQAARTRRSGEPLRRPAHGEPAAAHSLEGSGRPGEARLEGPQSPGLSIRKQAPAEVQVGAPALFEIVVRNVGQTVAEAVEVRDEIPLGAQLVETNPYADVGPTGELVWQLGDLRPGGEARIEIELLPLTEGELGSQAVVTCATRASVRTTATRPELVLDVAAPSKALAGTELRLKIKVTNTGTGVARRVALEDDLPEGLSHPAGPALAYEVGELAPGQAHELELVVTATKAGGIINQLVARGEGDLEAVAEMQLEVVAPELTVDMSGPRRRFLERQATYTLSVANPGTAPAREVELVTYLPPGMKFVEANHHGQYDPRTRTVRWSLEELPARQRGEVTLVAIPLEPGEHLLRLEGTARSGLKAQFEQPVLVEGLPAVSFEVVDVEDPIEIGAETTYRVRVSNEGTKAAGQVELVVIVPDAMQPLSAAGPTRHLIDGQRLIFDALDRLEPKSEQIYEIKVRALAAGDLRLRAQLLTDEMETPVTKEENTQVYGDD